MRTQNGRNSSFSFACVALGRVLSSLLLLLLVVMPLTEYFWHFDKFFSGGQDFEFGLLTALAFFCLVLVLLQHGRQAIRLLMSIRTWHSFVFRRADPGARGSRSGLIAAGHAIPLPSPALSLYTLPIQV